MNATFCASPSFAATSPAEHATHVGHQRHHRDYGFRVAPRPIDAEEAAWDPSWCGNESWMAENVGRYVERTELLARRNILTEDEATHARIAAVIDETAGLPAAE